MAGLTTLGAYHTAFALAALFFAFITLVQYKEISPRNLSGLIYILTTAVTAATSLGIYQHGGFGFQHFLSILTLVGLVTGTLATRSGLFGASSRIVQAYSFSPTILFHLIPGVTEVLTRLPLGNPIVESYISPVLIIALLLLIAVFIAGMRAQLRWLRGPS